MATKHPQKLHIGIAVRNDEPSRLALEWAIKEFATPDNISQLLFTLIHVVSDVHSSHGKLIRVSEAEHQSVVMHVCDHVLPFLETLQEICDYTEVTSSIEVVKNDLRPEAIVEAAVKLRIGYLILGGTQETTTWGTIAFCTAPGKQAPGCTVISVVDGQKVVEVKGTGELVMANQDFAPSSVLGVIESENDEAGSGHSSFTLTPNGSSSFGSVGMTPQGGSLPLRAINSMGPSSGSHGVRRERWRKKLRRGGEDDVSDDGISTESLASGELDIASGEFEPLESGPFSGSGPFWGSAELDEVAARLKAEMIFMDAPAAVVEAAPAAISEAEDGVASGVVAAVGGGLETSEGANVETVGKENPAGSLSLVPIAEEDGAGGNSRRETEGVADVAVNDDVSKGAAGGGDVSRGAAEDDGVSIVAAGYGDVSQFVAEHDDISKLVPEHDDTNKVAVGHDDVSNLVAEHDDVSKVAVGHDDVSNLVAEQDDVSKVVEGHDDVSNLVAEQDDVSKVAAENDDVSNLVAEHDDVSKVAVRHDDVSNLVAEHEDVTKVAAENDDVSKLVAEDDEVSKMETENDDVRIVKAVDNDVSKVAAENDDVSIVAGDDDDVSKVNTEDDDVSIVAGDDDDVSKVNTEDDDVSKVAADDDDVSKVNTEDDDVSKVAAEDDSGPGTDSITVAVSNDDISRTHGDASSAGVVISDVSKVNVENDDVSKVTVANNDVIKELDVGLDSEKVSEEVLADISKSDQVGSDAVVVADVSGADETVADVSRVEETNADIIHVEVREADISTKGETDADISEGGVTEAHLSRTEDVSADVSKVGEREADISSRAEEGDAERNDDIIVMAEKPGTTAGNADVSISSEMEAGDDIRKEAEGGSHDISVVNRPSESDPLLDDRPAVDSDMTSALEEHPATADVESNDYKQQASQRSVVDSDPEPAGGDRLADSRETIHPPDQQTQQDADLIEGRDEGSHGGHGVVQKEREEQQAAAGMAGSDEVKIIRPEEEEEGSLVLDDDGLTPIQRARLAYRSGGQVTAAVVGHGSQSLVSEGSGDRGSSRSLFSMSTRSTKLSGKLTAKLNLPASMGGRAKMDRKSKVEAEVAVGRAIRESMGHTIPTPTLVSNFRVYTTEELEAAMDHYSPHSILGEGSYGIVYRGQLEGQDVAIKQLKNPDFGACVEEIERELEVQKRCDHPNLVKLCGYSMHDRTLVYEYLSNGSVEDRLLCVGGSPPLLWPDRCRIAMETAAALHHLHTREPPIVHRDVKPANVLLDEHFVAKLGDVGLARLMLDMESGNTHIVRKSVIVGTEHYVDPEYLCARRGYLGPKSDVYSFGIVLLQLLVGGIPNLRKIDMAVEQENLLSLLDPRAGQWPEELAMDLANLGLWCSEMDRRDRPDLEEEVIPALIEICEVAAKEVLEEEARKQKAQEELVAKEEALAVARIEAERLKEAAAKEEADLHKVSVGKLEVPAIVDKIGPPSKQQPSTVVPQPTAAPTKAKVAAPPLAPAAAAAAAAPPEQASTGCGCTIL